jgi:hypothetical protein
MSHDHLRRPPQQPPDPSCLLLPVSAIAQDDGPRWLRGLLPLFDIALTISSPLKLEQGENMM